MPWKRDHSRRLLTFTRQMRKAPTHAERKLWHLLRRGKIDGNRFRRQVPVAGYILDSSCIEAGIAVEADGGQHYDHAGKEYDRRRSEMLERKGIRVIRFSDTDILKHPYAVQATIHRAVVEQTPSLPSPGIPGEGKS